MTITKITPPQPAVKEREVWIDWAKAIGILLVVMGHSHYASEDFLPFISMINMPMFFVVSGYLFSTKKPFRQIMQSNFKSLLVPYYLYNLILSPYWVILGTTKTLQHQTFDWHTLFITPAWRTLFGIIPGQFSSPTWFLLALIWCKIACYNLHCKSNVRIITTIAIWITLFICTQTFDIPYPFAIECACTGMIWFEVGQLFRLFKSHINVSAYTQWFCVPMGAVICFYILKYNGSSSYVLAQTGGLIGLFGTAVGLISYFGICKALGRYNHPLVTLVSKASIVIMCLHMFVIGWLEYVFHYQGGLLFTFAVDLSVTVALAGLFPIFQKHMPSLVGSRKA